MSATIATRGSASSALLARSGRRGRFGRAAGIPMSLCLVLPSGRDATTAALDEGLDPTRTVALDTLFGPAQAPHADDDVGDRADAGAMPRKRCSPPTACRSTSFTTAPALSCSACWRTSSTSPAISRSSASRRPADIDLAVRIGLAYPMGPLAWGDALGPARVLRILERARARLRRSALSAQPVAVAPRAPRRVAADTRGLRRPAPTLQRRERLQLRYRASSMMIVSLNTRKASTMSKARAEAASADATPRPDSRSRFRRSSARRRRRCRASCRAPRRARKDARWAAGDDRNRSSPMKSSKRRQLLRGASMLAAGGVAAYAMSGSATAQPRTPFSVSRRRSFPSPAAASCFRCAASTASDAITPRTRGRWDRIRRASRRSFSRSPPTRSRTCRSARPSITRIRR